MSAWSGGCLPSPGGVSAWSWGVCLPGLGGVSAWSGGCVPGPGGSAWSGGVCLVRGVSGPGGVVSDLGGGIPACTEADPLPPVNRMTDRCKNITLATTSLRPVKISQKMLQTTDILTWLRTSFLCPRLYDACTVFLSDQ